jgi:hypothetical protein|nr:MAG TPA: Prefoldin subunit 1, Prefoldin subunit/CCT, PFD, CryoEM, Molecular Chaperone.8A [Caudoviricetes sp.]
MDKIERLETQLQALKDRKIVIDKEIEEVTTNIKKLKNARWYVNTFGEIGEIPENYDSSTVLNDMNKQGNVFTSFRDAEKEVKKRILKKEIEEFRNECNGDWKPSWKMSNEGKYFIGMKDGELQACVNWTLRNFSEFGIFENKYDCDRAVEIFGDRILELYN